MVPLSVNIDQSWPVGEISWAVVALVGIVAVTYLIARGFLQNAEIDVGDKGKIIFGGASKTPRPPTKSQQAMLAMAALTEEKYRMASDIRAAQKKAIEDYYDRFMDALHDADYLPAELLWRHFTDPLVNAAEENHILGQVDDEGNLKPSYVQEKMLFVQSRHSRMIQKKRNCLPEWSELEAPLHLIMVSALQQFATIAKKGWGTFRERVGNVRVIAPKMSFLLDRLVENV